MVPAGRMNSKAPDKGSFPLDHFHECNKEAKQYTECVVKHQLMPKRCRDFQVSYLQCRMNAGLMEKEDMEKLGINEETSWESEEQEQNHLFEKIQMLKKRGMENSQKHQEQVAKEMQQRQAQEKQAQENLAQGEQEK